MKRYDAEVLHLGALRMNLRANDAGEVAEIDPVECLVNEPEQSENPE
jgi:hypothetical protein